MTKLVAFAKEHEVVLVHDFAYADSASTGTNRRRSSRCGRQRTSPSKLYTLTKSFSMAGGAGASWSAMPRSWAR